MWRRRIRTWSGVVIVSFVVPHLINHALGLISLEAADTMLKGMTKIWAGPPGGPVLMLAFLTHFFLSLSALYQRSTLRMPLWEALQICFGILIFPMILIHFLGTAIVGITFDFVPTYEYVVSTLWVVKPLRGIQQSFMLLVVWIHLCIGIHFWLRVTPWYAKAAPYLFAFAVLLPVLSLLGFARLGEQIAASAATDPHYLDRVYAPIAHVPRENINNLLGLEFIGWQVFGAIIASVFIARFIRRLYRNRHGVYRLSLPDGSRYIGPVGQTILETLRIAGVPHAAVCGGRGRCTTCRVHVGDAIKELPLAGETEQKALTRINAEPEVRLACQTRPRRNLKIIPLLPPTVSARYANQPGGIQGREQKIAVMFIDLRGSTKLGEEKLPYDVLFVLNQYFAEMSEALAETRGHYAQFSGDGLMALYGLENGVDEGCRDAIRGAAAMLKRLEGLNRRLAKELKEPLRMGIGIHCGDAIVGTMGPPTAQNFSAIGDDVNVAARLESLTKQYGCALIISEAAAECAGADATGLTSHVADVRGRDGDIPIYTLDDPAALLPEEEKLVVA